MLEWKYVIFWLRLQTERPPKELLSMLKPVCIFIDGFCIYLISVNMIGHKVKEYLEILDTTKSLIGEVKTR